MQLTNNSFYRFKAVQGDYMELGLGIKSTLDRSHCIWGVTDLGNEKIGDRKMVDSLPHAEYPTIFVRRFKSLYPTKAVSQHPTL